MKRTARLDWRFCAAAAWLGAAVGGAQAQEAAARVHAPHEVTLSATGAYANPYVELAADATLTGPDGVRCSLPLFWDGGDVWRLRFAPPASQGFNVVHITLLSEGGDGDSGGPPFDGSAAQQINPDYWREVDQRIAYANDKQIRG